MCVIVTRIAFLSWRCSFKEQSSRRTGSHVALSFSAEDSIGIASTQKIAKGEPRYILNIESIFEISYLRLGARDGRGGGRAYGAAVEQSAEKLAAHCSVPGLLTSGKHSASANSNANARVPSAFTDISPRRSARQTFVCTTARKRTQAYVSSARK